MHKKDKGPKTIPPTLAEDERELFLNAFYQGSFLNQDKFSKKPPDEPAQSADKSQLDQERELFIRAINEGFSKLPVQKPDLSKGREVLRTAKKRSEIDGRIDLHGMFVEDAVNALFRFLDFEKRRGSKNLLIIHGKGSGALKQAVWSLIDTHPGVNDFQVAPGKLGGAGAILVRINRNVKRK